MGKSHITSAVEDALHSKHERNGHLNERFTGKEKTQRAIDLCVFGVMERDYLVACRRSQAAWTQVM